MEENIIGGVSPFKRKSMRRGKSYGKGKRGAGDTRYKREKWVKPASGGTTVKPKADKPPDPKKPYKIKDGVPVINPPGDVNITEGDNIINQTSGGGYDTKTVKTEGKPATDDVYKKTKGRLPTYDEAWDQNLEGINSMYKNKQAYKDDMLGIKKGDARDIEREKARKEAEKETEVLVKKGEDETQGSETTTTTYVPGEGNIANIYDYGHNSPTPMLGGVGKYKLGGYRAMKKNRK